MGQKFKSDVWCDYTKIFIKSFRIGKQLQIIPPVLQLPTLLNHQSSLRNQKSQKKFERLIVPGKKEVNNFGFPTSFGQAGVDFPMYDLNR